MAGNWFVSNQNEHIRRKAISDTKEFFEKELKKKTLSPIPAEAYPLRCEWDLYCPIDKADWDADNLWFYWKYFCDTLRRVGIIPDDTIQYITQPPGPRFFPVESLKERKFVFRFYEDDREAIQKHDFYKSAA